MSDKLPDTTLRRNSRLVRRVVTWGAAAMLLMGAALLYMLMLATNNQAMYEQDYALLFVLNVAVAALLFAAIAWIAFRLYQRWRAGRFGTRLLTKLAAIFVLVGLAPGLLIYGVSYQFVSRSIETWFDVKVEGALQAGLSLGRVTLETPEEFTQWLAVGQKIDAERQIKKDDIEHSRLVRLKKIARPATRAERDAQEDKHGD